jgi:hypothetical protein
MVLSISLCLTPPCLRLDDTLGQGDFCTPAGIPVKNEKSVKSRPRAKLEAGMARLNPLL